MTFFAEIAEIYVYIRILYADRGDQKIHMNNILN